MKTIKTNWITLATICTLFKNYCRDNNCIDKFLAECLTATDIENFCYDEEIDTILITKN